jgi:hypothetical protein
MVILNIELDDFPMFPLAYGFEDSSEFVFNLFRREYFAPVFRSYLVYGVAFKRTPQLRWGFLEL